MASQPQAKIRPKTSFRPSRTIGPVYVGGPATISEDGKLLFTIIDLEEGGVHITSTDTGAEIARFDTDSAVTALCHTSIPGALDSTSSIGYLIVCLRSLSIRIFSISDPSSSNPIAQPKSTIPKSHDAPISICISSTRHGTRNLVATGAADGVVKVWDITRSVCTHVFKNHGGVVSSLCFFIPDRSTLNSNSSKKAISSSGKKGGKKESSSRATEEVYLITGSTDSRVRLFNLMDRKLVQSFEGHSSVVRCLDVLPNSKMFSQKKDDFDDLIISGGRDRVVIIWSLNSGQAIKTITVLETIESSGIIFTNPDDDDDDDPKSSKPLVYTGGDKGQIRLWDISTTDQVTSQFSMIDGDNQNSDPIIISSSPPLLDIIHLPKLSTLVAFTIDQTIIYYSVPSLKITKQIVGSNDEVIDTVLVSSSQNLSSTNDERLGTLGTHLALASNSAAIRLYDFSESLFDTQLLMGHSDIVLTLATGISPNSEDETFGKNAFLMSGGKDRTARLWLPRQIPTTKSATLKWTWNCVGICTGHIQAVGAVALPKSLPSKFNTDSSGKTGAKFALTASSDQTLKIWDLEPLSSLEISPETRNRFQHQQQSPIKLKALVTQKIHEKDINSLDISPDSNLIASGSQDKTCKIFALEYNPSTKSRSASANIKLFTVLRGHRRGVWSVKFSNKDRVIATGSGDRTIKLWNVMDGQCLKTFEGHTNTVLRVNFINFDTQLVSSASDGLVKIWNIKEEDCATTLDGHEDRIWAVSVTKDEKKILSGGADSRVVIWDDVTEEEEMMRIEKEEERVVKNQDIDNLERVKDYKSAILLSMELQQPRRLLQLFSKVAGNSAEEEEEGTASISGSFQVDEAIRSLSNASLMKLLEYVRDWNTTVKTSDIAQRILHVIVQSRPPEELLSLAHSDLKDDGDASSFATADGIDDDNKAATSISKRNIDGGRGQIAELLEALTVYTERHYARADRMLSSQSFLLDYTLSQMLGGMDDDTGR